MRVIVGIASAIVGVSLLSLPAVAQQKTVRACQAEWRANKDANQAQGITEKAYVAQCRAAAATTTTAAPAAPPSAAGGQKTVRACQAEWRANKDANQARGITEKAYVAQCRAGATTTTTTTAPVAPPPAAGGQKTVRACQAEWRANKADYQARGITEKAYVAQCRTGGTIAAPAPAPAPPPAPPPVQTTAPAPSAPPPTANPRPASVTPTGAYQYATEGQARARCFAGTVVWANTNSKIYHFTGYKDYGNTKTGAYMCETDATSQGMRASKNEKHP
jgi:hypothetical protein